MFLLSAPLHVIYNITLQHEPFSSLSFLETRLFSSYFFHGTLLHMFKDKVYRKVTMVSVEVDPRAANISQPSETDWLTEPNIEHCQLGR